VSLIKLEHVSKFYHNGTNVSKGIIDISVSFEMGEFVAITGESGSGKTTLLNVISGLDGYDEGELYLNNEETSHFQISEWEKYRANNVGFVFQNYNIVDSFTVLDNVLVALDAQVYDNKTKKEKALELIEKVGLLQHKNQRASRLSGGEKQRCVIARALAINAKIICCDEPTGNLDSETGAQIIKLLHEISKEKLVLIVTHNFQEVEPYISRKLVLSDGDIIEDSYKGNVIPVQSNCIFESKVIPFSRIAKLALKTTFALPKRFVLVVLFLLIISFITMSQLSNFLFMDQETNSYESDQVMYFQRKDKEKLGESDFNEALKNGFSQDKIHIYAENSRFSDIFGAYDDSMLNDFGFMTSGPWDYYFNIQSSDLISGRLPIAYNEIVVANTANFNVGDKIYLGIIGNYYYNSSIIHLGEFEITGVLNDNFHSSVWYFSDQFFNHKFENVTYAENAYLIFIEGNETANRYINKVNNSTYTLIYPYRSGENSILVELSSLLMFFIAFGLFLSLVVCSLFFYIFTKNLMVARLKDFSIFRSIGISEASLGKLIILEQFYLGLISSTLFIILFTIVRLVDETIRETYKYLTFNHYLLFFVIIVSLSVIIGFRFNKKIFKYSVIEGLSEGSED
jgi:ABC-type lipoprotein export system ATPase subunit/ABC-type antimicrobial peptide transport system permease subunit